MYDLGHGATLQISPPCGHQAYLPTCPIQQCPLNDPRLRVNPVKPPIRVVKIQQGYGPSAPQEPPLSPPVSADAEYGLAVAEDEIGLGG